MENINKTSKDTESKIKLRKFWNNTFLGAILIGIIGSALWEKLLSPFCSFVFSKILSLINLVFINYSDSLYKEISKGFYEYSSVQFYILFLALISTFAVNFYIYKVRNTSPKNSLFELMDNQTEKDIILSEK